MWRLSQECGHFKWYLTNDTSLIEVISDMFAEITLSIALDKVLITL